MILIGGTQYVVRRLLLSENSPLSLPANSFPLASDVVISDETDEPLVEFWVAIPEAPTPNVDTPTSTVSKVIYTNTEVYEDEDYFTSADIEREVSRTLREFHEEDENDW